MAKRHQATFEIGAPAPDKGRVNGWLLLAAFLGGPLAWSLQLIVGSAVSGALCIAGDGSRLPTAPGSWSQPAIVAVNVAALVMAIAAFALSYHIYGQTGRNEPSSGGGVMEAGEGRTRFLAIWALWTSVLFAIAILFNTIALFWTSLCGI